MVPVIRILPWSPYTISKIVLRGYVMIKKEQIFLAKGIPSRNTIWIGKPIIIGDVVPIWLKPYKQPW